MKDEDSNPLEPVGDEPIEARIVAWVLGDASAFEAAELERLCEEQPELQVFRERMQALHGLLAEAEHAPSDAAWKLPSEKRAKLEALFNSSAVAAEPVATVLKPKRSFQPWIRQALLASAACIVLAGGFYGVITPMSGGDRVARQAESRQMAIVLREDAIPRSPAAPMPRAEGYASAAPVLPEIAASDVEFRSGGSGGMGGAGFSAGGMSGARFRSKAEASKELADNRNLPAPETPFPVTPATPAEVRPGDFDKALASGKMARRPEGNISSLTEYEAPELPGIARNGVSGNRRDASDGPTGVPGLPAPRPAITAPRSAGDAVDHGNLDAMADSAEDRFDEAAGEAIVTKAKQRQLALRDTARMPSRPIPAAQPAPSDFASELAGAKKADVASGAGGATGAGVPAQPSAGQAVESQTAFKDGLDSQGARKNQFALRIGGTANDSDTETANALSAFNGGKMDGVDPPYVSGKVGGSLFFGEETSELRRAAPEPAAKPSDGDDALAQREMGDRAKAVEGADRLLMAGRDAYAKGDYAEATKAYQSAAEALPDAPVTADRKKAIEDHLVDGQIALGMQYRKGGKYAEAEALNRSVLEKDPDNLVAKRELDWLSDPNRSTPNSEVAELRKSLSTSDGSFDLGKYDAAKKEFQAALRRDPSDQAARQNLERLALAKNDYRQDAYDQTRSELLAQVDKAWELKIPREDKIDKVAPAPVPTDETSAVEEPFSTFSLHVSDASFKLAKAALDRGERLSADQIRVEEFYNAFDYGDAAPAPGEAVACAIEQGRHPILPQRNLVRVAMRVGSTGRAEGQPLNLVVLLDNSGSMEREDRSAGLKAAVGQLASLLKAGDSVTLAGFSRTPHLLADRLPGDQAAKLVELVDGLPSAGGTNLEEALKLAGELAVQRKNPAAQNRIVLLTDGAANLGNAKPEELAEKIAALRQQGIAFDAAGIGAGGVNDRMLEALTRNGNGRYYIVNDASDADANFARQLAGAFRPAAENVKVQVRFNPERVARYKLIGFEKHRLNKEDFHNDSVDAAEMAADEAGVALYQVEVLPQGTGEIGEVSVRFRDAAAGQMVERSWTIQHDAKARSFDQASPSLQLAGLSMLAAEKLRGGPMADATDFSSLAPQIARVRAYYGTSSRVGELVGMTGRLK